MKTENENRTELNANSQEIVLVNGAEWKVGGQCPVRLAGNRCPGTVASVESENPIHGGIFGGAKEQRVEYVCSDVPMHHNHLASRVIIDARSRSSSE